MKLHSMPTGGIGQRTLLRFAIPLLIVILLLGYTVTVLYLSDTRYAMEERGNLLVRHLAVLSEFGIVAGDRETLQNYADSILLEPDVIHVAIEDLNHSVLVSAGNPDHDLPANKIAHFTAPVTRSGVEVSDFGEEELPGAAGSTTGAVLSYTAHVTLSKDSERARESDILSAGIMATTIALLASLLLAFLVARGVSEPIERLTTTVKALTTGKLSARNSETSPGELGALEHGINQMAGTMEDAQNRLRSEVEEATAALQETVRKLENRNIELDQARSDAVKAGTAKSDFLARMSHEIRTPLSAVIGFSSLLEKTALSDNQREYISTITQAASQLLLIIDDILGYTRLDSNTLELDTVSFDLRETLEGVISMLSMQAHEKRLELVLSIHTDVPQHITSDPKRISQVLTNLVNNAIKFTTEGHVIVEVSVPESDPGSDRVTIQLAVTDTGIGLDETQQEHIFDPFIQADSSTSRRFGGTGLGLSISKKLVELLDGEMQVSSTPGKGSTFSFTINVPYETAAHKPATSPLAGRKVLLYDRNPFTLRSQRNRFISWGATVFNTTERSRLPAMLATGMQQGSPPELLVMGLSHEEYEGIPRDAWLQDVRKVSNCPAIVLIGDDLHELPCCLIENSTCILSKPARSERLLRSIREMLSLQDVQGTDTTAEQPVREEGFSCPNVLVVEDNPFNRELFSRLLGTMGIHAVVATNGEEACTLAGHTKYDLILMDIHMPVMGGIRATQLIRKGLNQLTPVIALTADVFADSDHYLQSYGLNDILYKPVSEQKLVDTLHRWCRPAGQDRNSRHEDGVKLSPDLKERLRRELDNQLRALREAVSGGDAASIADHMHQLKGLVEYFGLAEFSACFAMLEKAHETGHVQSMQAALDELERLLAGTGADNPGS